jgi:hypothetical protein
MIRAQIIWAKERLVMSQGDYHWQHEPCWYAVRKRLSHAVTVSGYRQQAGRTHDAHRIRVRLHAGEPQPDIGAAAGSASAARPDGG